MLFKETYRHLCLPAVNLQIYAQTNPQTITPRLDERSNVVENEQNVGQTGMSVQQAVNRRGLTAGNRGIKTLAIPLISTFQTTLEY